MTSKDYRKAPPGASKNSNKRNRSKDKAPKLLVLRPSRMGLAVGFLWDMAARDVEAVHGDDVHAAVRDYLKRRIDAADGAPLYGLAETVARHAARRDCVSSTHSRAGRCNERARFSREHPARPACVDAGVPQRDRPAR